MTVKELIIGVLALILLGIALKINAGAAIISWFGCVLAAYADRIGNR